MPLLSITHICYHRDPLDAALVAQARVHLRMPAGDRSEDLASGPGQ
jgi:hypothetical protein